MEFGLIPQLHEFQLNSNQSLQKVSAANPANLSKEVTERIEAPEVLSIKAEKAEETPEIKSSKVDFSKYNEVNITNMNFGFNESSRDFFVKVERGEKEFQYPTDEMMKLKAHLMNLNESNIS